MALWALARVLDDDPQAEQVAPATQLPTWRIPEIVDFLGGASNLVRVRDSSSFSVLVPRLRGGSAAVTILNGNAARDPLLAIVRADGKRGWMPAVMAVIRVY
jgi:hypothetical protein